DNTNSKYQSPPPHPHYNIPSLGSSLKFSIAYCKLQLHHKWPPSLHHLNPKIDKLEDNYKQP
ncbi:unnamed protein product, partial [Allacma fusca]